MEKYNRYSVNFTNSNDIIMRNISNDNQYVDKDAFSISYVITISIILSFIDITTLVGNLLVVIAVLTTRSLSTVTNYFIMSLAVADMLVAVFVLPISIYTVTNPNDWIFGRTICTLWLLSDVMLCTASILNLCCISLDRYFAITRPLQYSRQRSPKRARGMIAVVWIASIFISFPPLFGWRGKDDFKQNGPCTLNKLLSYRIFSSMGSFFLPALVMLFVYARIFKVIHDREKYLMSSSEVTRKRNLPKQVHLLRGTSNTSEANKNRKDSVISSNTTNSLRNSIPRKKSNFFKPKFFQENSDQVSKPYKNEMNTIKECDRQDENSFNRKIDFDCDSASDKKCCYKLFPKKLKQSQSENVAQLNDCAKTENEIQLTKNTDVSDITKLKTKSLMKSSIGDVAIKTAYSSAPVLNGECYNLYNNNSNNNKADNRKSNMDNSERICTQKFERNYSSEQNKKKKKAYLGSSVHHYLNDSDYQLSNTFSNNSTSTPTTQTTSRYQEQLRLLKESKAAKTLAIVVGGFIICWLPFFVVYLFEAISPATEVTPELINCITWLGYFNSSLNPFIYAFYSKQFRSAFYRLTIGKCYSGKNDKYFNTNKNNHRFGLN